MNKNVKDIIKNHNPKFYFDKKESKILSQNLSLIEKLDNDTSMSILLSIDTSSLCKFMSSSKTNEQKSLPALKKIILKLAKDTKYNKGTIVNYIQEQFITNTFSRQVIDTVFDNINYQLYGNILYTFSDILSMNQIKTYIDQLSPKQLCDLLQQLGEND